MNFSDQVEITAGELAVGDFVVKINAQHGYRETDIRSAVTAITRHFDRWYQPAPRRGARRTFLPSAALTFTTGPGRHIPAAWTIIVRRPEGA